MKFYGLDDLGTYPQVEHAIEILERYDPSSRTRTISDILELHNVQLFAENNLFPKRYSDSQREACRALISKLSKTIAKFFGTISDDNIASAVVNVDYEYRADLLQLLSRYKVYDRCAASTVLPALDQTHIDVTYMLTSQNLVRFYDQEVRSRLVSDPRNAEILIRKYVEKDAHHFIYLPRSFTSADARTLLDSYLDSDHANPNFVDLIATARTIKEAGIDAKLKLKAKRKYSAWAEDFFKGNEGVESGCEVSISDTQAEPVMESFHGLVGKFSYSRCWLEDNLDFPTILNNFLYLFEFANYYMLLSMPSYQAELGVFERALKISGRDAYPIGVRFQFKEQRSLLQTVLYYRFLQSKHVELESVIAWFFAEYIQEEFGATNLRFTPSSKLSSNLEKSRHLFSEMESVVRQFSLYVENGELDTELLTMTSEQIRYKNIPSLVVGKYVYAGDSQDIRSILHLLFSDQSEIRYINENVRADDGTRLLIKNHVEYDDFADYQKRSIDYLIGLGVIETAGKRVQLADIDQILIIKAIFDAESTSYYHYSTKARTRIDDMVGKGWLVRRGSLLTDAEGSYFNYNLNQAEFSNGPDMRNKYLHGSQIGADDEEQHFRTYITALKLLIALVIKINDDFWLRDVEERNQNSR
ncbi:MAG TPA: hypothetical protein VFQ44_06625 [Streptosporangiaceae bacterium]|nr:hypothetical protein [Streptosporangiaceae bacterium]